MPNYPGPYNTGFEKWKKRPFMGWPSIDGDLTGGPGWDRPHSPEEGWYGPGGTGPPQDPIFGPGDNDVISPGYPGGPPRGPTQPGFPPRDIGPKPLPAPSWGPDNPFWDAFESDPEGQRANYFSYQDKFGKSPNQKRYFQQQFQNTLDKYRGIAGAQIKGGAQNVSSLSSYLDELFEQGGGAQQEWMNMSPRSRGLEDSRYAPPARWNLNSGPAF